MAGGCSLLTSGNIRAESELTQSASIVPGADKNGTRPDATLSAVCRRPRATHRTAATVSEKALIMEPRQVVENWVSCFNQADVDALAALYSEDATNHQVVREPTVGRAAIREMFAREFDRATMVCQIEHIFQDGDWAILEWTDPNGLRGCGFFNVLNDRIVFQRGYFNELSFLRLHGLPLAAE